MSLITRGKAVVLATHQLQYINYADRVLLLGANGSPVAYGGINEIVDAGQLNNFSPLLISI